VAKSLYVTSTFMGLSPGGRMHPGRDHEAEKSGNNNRGWVKRCLENSRW
jgi:hypothetical protein